MAEVSRNILLVLVVIVLLVSIFGTISVLYTVENILSAPRLSSNMGSGEVTVNVAGSPEPTSIQGELAVNVIPE